MQLPLGAGVRLYGLDVMCSTQAHMFEHFGSQLAELFWKVVEMCVCVWGDLLEEVIARW